MTILIISNIAQWIFIIFMMTNKSTRWIKFEWNKTLFGKVRYGFKIMLWKKTGPNSARGKPLVKFNWANPELLNDDPRCKPKSLWAKPFIRG